MDEDGACRNVAIGRKIRLWYNPRRPCEQVSEIELSVIRTHRLLLSPLVVLGGLFAFAMSCWMTWEWRRRSYLLIHGQAVCVRVVSPLNPLLQRATVEYECDGRTHRRRTELPLSHGPCGTPVPAPGLVALVDRARPDRVFVVPRAWLEPEEGAPLRRGLLLFFCALPLAVVATLVTGAGFLRPGLDTADRPAVALACVAILSWIAPTLIAIRLKNLPRR